jgi:hypothetical protein
MVALWVWAIVFWISGLEKNQPLSLILAAFLIGVCALAKYFGIALIPLLLVYSLMRNGYPDWMLLKAGDILSRAKLFIDASGKVASVEVTSVDPPSPLDEAFRAAARAGLSSWRFAAAEKDGQAIASETLVGLQFEVSDAPLGGDRASVDTWTPLGDSGFESARYDQRARILSMTVAARVKVADELAAKAESLLKRGQRANAANEWCQVVTDFGGQKQADALLQNVGATYFALGKLLGDRIPPRPMEERIRVYVFETSAQFQSLIAGTAPFEGSAGIYYSAGVLALQAQHPTISYFVASMLHETTHAFVDRHLVRQGVQLPRWLDEGLAEYVGESDIKDRKIVPGGHAKRQELGAAHGAIVFWQTPSRARSEGAKRAQRQKRALTLQEIVSAGTETFYGKDVELYYAQGWLAVHFLRHGRPEWAEGPFPKFLLYVAEGYPADQALRTAYGVEAGQLETSFQKYVKSF